MVNYFSELLKISPREKHFKEALTRFSINHFLEEVWSNNSILVSFCQYDIIGRAEELQTRCTKAMDWYAITFRKYMVKIIKNNNNTTPLPVVFRPLTP